MKDLWRLIMQGITGVSGERKLVIRPDSVHKIDYRLGPAPNCINDPI